MADTDNLQIPDTPAPDTQPDAENEALLTVAKDDSAENYIRFREDQVRSLRLMIA
jgi:hypothetical protein